MNEEDVQGEVDELEDDLDMSQDLQDYQGESYEGSIPNLQTKSEGLYDWFWKVVSFLRLFYNLSSTLLLG